MTLGQFSIAGSENLVTAVNTFFAQGNSVGIYLLELGVQKGGVSKEIAALKSYMEDPLQRFYAYLVPQTWDGDAEFISLAKLHTTNEAMQYFFVLTKTNYVSPYAGIKSVIATADDTYPATNAAAAGDLKLYLRITFRNQQGAADGISLSTGGKRPQGQKFHSGYDDEAEY